MSSSVQFESGNTRIVSPWRMRVLNRFHSSGRWLRGSHAWPCERNEKMRSLARLFFVAPRAAEGCVEAVKIERLLQRFGFHHVRVHGGAGRDRADAVRDALLVDVDDQVEAEPLCRLVAERDHVPELPRGVDMHEREGQWRRMKRFHRKLQHDARILADRVEHHRVLEFGGHLANDLDRLGFEALEMLRQDADRYGGGGLRNAHEGSGKVC